MSFLAHLQQATENIGSEYFELIRAKAKPRQRERVYAYELYHQLRIIIGSRRLTLTAEPDKRGNAGFDPKTAPNPDLIFHVPGTNRRNFAVIEIECTPDKRHLEKDLRNLKLMKSKGYESLFLLIFGRSSVDWQRLLAAAEATGIPLSSVTVLIHPSAGCRATKIEPRSAV